MWRRVRNPRRLSLPFATTVAADVTAAGAAACLPAGAALTPGPAASAGCPLQS